MKNREAVKVEEVPDEFEVRIQKTGCSKYNELVQECYFKHHDWRKCQSELKAFQECFRRINQNQSKET